MTKATTKQILQDIPDVRADEPERAMEQFTDGLRRVLAAQKPTPKRKYKHRRQSK